MNNLLQIGIVLTAIDRMSGVIGGATDKAGQGFSRLQQRIHQCSQAMTEMGTKATALGQGLVSALKTPITAFADLDEASTQLRVAMMDNFGQIPPQFAEINRQAIELGNVLPGTTADFVNSARALIENGTALETIVGGGLKAASYLGVILKLPQAGAAEMVAKFREAFGLAEHELVKMADMTQRAKFAFGLGPEEIKYAAQYAGATLNNLKLVGIENTKMFLAMQGIARQKGMEGSVFGTNFASMLNNIGMMESKLHRNSKIMKEVNADLRHAGISLQFFDKAGKFVGLENMVAQLEKLKVLSAQDKLNVMNRLFGMEGGRVASMLSDAGVGGLHGALDTMARQADLMQRIEETNKSAKNIWEALTGTITNFWAAFGGPMVTALYPYMKAVNDFVGGPMLAWVDRNKDLVKWLGLGAMAVAGLLLVLGGLGIVVGAVASGLAVLGGVLAAIVSPVGIAVAGIASGAALIIMHWSKISAFFKGVGQGLDAGLAPLQSIGGKVAGWFTPLWAIGQAAYNFFLKPWVDAISQLIGWFGRLVVPITQSAAAAQAFGYRVGSGIAQAITFVGDLTKAFLDLPAKLYNSGVGMITQLLAGIKSAAGALYAGVAEVAAKVRSYWPFSPAKEGPLRDLHRVKIIETIAENVQAAPLTNAMGSAAAAGMKALAPLHNADAAARAAHPAIAAKASSLMGDPRWQDPRLQAILRKHGGVAAAAGSSAPSTPKGLGRRVPVYGAPATPASIAHAQAAAGAAHQAVAAKAASLMHDPKWQDPRLQAILRKHGGATAAAKPLPATPAPASRPQARPGGGSGGQSGAARGAGGRAGGGSVTVTYNVNAQGGADKGAIMAALKQHEHELVRLIEQVMARNGRRQY